MKKKTNSNKIITYAAMIFLLVVFIGGFVWGYKRVVAMEGTLVPNILTEGKTPAPADAENGKIYADEIIAFAEKENTAKLKISERYICDSESIGTDGPDEIKTTCLFLKDGLINHLNKMREDEEYTYGEDLLSTVKNPDIDFNEAESFNCDYIYYECSSCGKKSDEPLSSCEKCGNMKPYNMKYKDEYEMSFVFPGDENLNTVRNNFRLYTPEEMKDIVKDEIDGAFNIENIRADYKNFTIIIKADRMTDEVTEIKYIKNADITAEITFLGDFSVLGTNNIYFNLKNEITYTFTWPHIILSAQEMVIDLKKTDNLLAELHCEDPLNTPVTWSVSDESVAKIDDEGYIKAGKNAGDVIVTASFEFLGRTYEDTCTVHIRRPVESTSMKTKKVSLSSGETFKAELKFIPSDASIKTVKWISEDESIAAVDENGIISGVSAGVVTVYSVSDDGYYKSTCEVTVE